MSAKYAFIHSLLTAAEVCLYPVASMCRWLSVSRSGYYHWATRPPSPAATRRAELALLVQHVFDDSDGRYGYRRVHAELVRLDVQVGPELVRALMSDLGLVACQPRPWRRCLTDQDLDAAPIPDLVARDFTATAPGVKLVGDITY